MTSLTKLVSCLTPTLKNALENGVGEAIKRKAVTVEISHWVYQLLFGGKHEELCAFLETQGVVLSVLQRELEQQMPYASTAGGQQPTISGSIEKLLEQAWMIASVEMGQNAISCEVLLLAARTPGTLGVSLFPVKALQPVSTDALRSFALQKANGADRGPVALAADMSGDGDALAKYTIDLTQQANEGKLDPVLGRTEEVATAIDVLLRKRQNNPILLGEPGVGKTAVVEGLAYKIVSGDVPVHLQGAQLRSLDMGLLQAGASVKGEFEERLNNVIKEVRASQTPIIIFIDEAHTMIGAGGAERQNDAANLLKPALARGEFRTVAATTFAEYKKYIQKDPALARRFQPITVEEPKRDAAVNILRGVANGLSDHHKVLIREEAIKAAVDLSTRFIPSRRLPDKAISLLDTACARVALSQNSRPKLIEKLEEDLRFAQVELDKSREEARLFGDVSIDEALLSDSVSSREVELGEKVAKWERQKEEVEARLMATKVQEGGESASPAVSGSAEVEGEVYVHPWVSEETIASVVSDWTGVPVASLSASEAERLLNLEDTLKSRVLGQNAGVEAISRSLKIARAGLTDTRKPIGVFMMCGPSGVGKTETALAIAEQFFGGEDAITTINMTEFKEAHKTSMLLGASAGYVGYGKGGVLTEAVRNRPYQVVLLDEMEKAHPEIQDVFFQIFDKGYISDSEGVKVDFRNTIIIMTANAGGEELREYYESGEGEKTDAQMTEYLRPLLLEHFSPAFIARTEVIAYRPLDMHVSAKLTKIHMNRIKKRIAAKYEAELVWDSSFTEFVVKANNDPLSGGRAIEAIINKSFLPKLAEECITRVIENKPLNTISVSHSDKDLKLVVD
ncbi:type VI secretion system ATPase TssH [Flexibacterium corallicola]|uniref:type VI secretion system ATPase TssH n=1 Tax=Flexibacterium corallicola TaxID=3037259 RepID=UPI00286F402A|nr:type VI secretion system ATPase TssH [Pseudovibrio sp. M1P-2-3]